MAVPAERLPFVGGELHFEIRGGGVEVDEVHLQAQKVGHREEDLPLQLLGGLQEEVHGPIQLLHSDLLETGDGHLVGHPVLEGQLAPRGQGPVGHQGEDQSLHRRLEPARFQETLEDVPQPQAVPQAVQEPHPAERPAACDAHVPPTVQPSLGSKGLFGGEEPADAPDQPLQSLTVDLVGPAEVVEDAGLRMPLLGSIRIYLS